ncbi:MAG: alpha-amylase [Chitinophagia bacterium]|nr:alpha-amylase [Chitinophagia bacterium]NCA30316.1 alpha-amylase [Chitinophagia bacterium]
MKTRFLHSPILLTIILLNFVMLSMANGQTTEAYPTNWFTKMQLNKIQILFRNTNANYTNAKVNANYPGLKVQGVHHFENGHYIAVDIEIDATAKPGIVNFIFSNKGEKTNANWALLPRREGRGTLFAQGINPSDLIYFLMPDRFSNGDASNDRIAGLKDQSLNRDSIFLRHGGDLKGVANHLDYLEKLGVSTLWMTPVIENDMPDRTEHGYAATNNYAIEKRLGGDWSYLALSDSLHKRGMKLIQDIVYNHFGRYHFLVQDAPDKNWLHQWPSYTQTHYREQAVFDPHHSKVDAEKMVNGWFTTEMPDVNQENPFVEKYLTQNAIWSVETYGIDAFRIDTYKYCNVEMMNRLNQALIDEYPNIFAYGECWVEGVSSQAYYVRNNLNIPYKSNLHATSDFNLLFSGILPALNEKNDWGGGVIKLYNTLSNDYLYKVPSNNVIFLDNHDMTRIHSSLGESIPKTKMAYAWLMTCRGIPQIYYGSEVLMKGISNPDGWVRLDFPGGWVGDKKNAFTEVGMTDQEIDFLHYVQLLGTYRKSSVALKTGELMQYLPEDGLYVYFRYTKGQSIMCVMNTDTKERKLNFEKYAERTDGFKGGKNIVTGEKIGKEFSITAMTMQVIELTK